jgi:glycosyltransferase involved in cell wall biosynthesis
MEYMALGKPVIATNSGGTPELVKNGVNGYLIPPNDINELIAKIQLLLESKNKRIQLGSHGRMIIKNEFSLEKMTNKFVELYNKI